MSGTSERHYPPSLEGGIVHYKPNMTGLGLRPVLQRWNFHPMLSNPADPRASDP